jgi:choline dehydrogenase-like flavoprotein
MLLGGCVLANRLTENPKWNVLIIEVGDVETPLQSIPVMAPYTVLSKYSWGYKTEPQTQGCLGKLKMTFIELIVVTQ